MSSNRSSLVNALISSGTAASSQRKDTKLNEAGDAVGELFSDVDAGTRPVSDLDSLLDFLSGNAQQSAQQPTGALGAGPSASAAPAAAPDEDEALQLILNSPTLPNGVKNAIRRLVVPNDPEHIQVDNNGTPRMVTTLQQEVANKEAARLALDSDLKEERDESKPTSLAGKLKAATSAPATPAGSVDKTAVKAKVDEIKELVENDVHTTMLSPKVDGLPELKTKVDELVQFVS